MIVDKKNKATKASASAKETKQTVESDEIITDNPIVPPSGTIPEEFRKNPMVEAYRAVREMLESIKVDPNDPDSPRLFKTVKFDNGQLSRIKGSKLNEEYGITFPAVFIHYIDVYFNQGISNIADGKATMRIHYVLNRLNNSDDVVETEGLEVFDRIIDTIEMNKHKYQSLSKRFQFQYWAQPLSFDDGLQPFWIDYQIWFTSYVSYRYKNYVDAYASIPPFTQHSDQDEIANPDRLPDTYDHPYEIAAKIEDHDNIFPVILPYDMDD